MTRCMKKNTVYCQEKANGTYPDRGVDRTSTTSTWEKEYVKKILNKIRGRYIQDVTLI